MSTWDEQGSYPAEDDGVVDPKDSLITDDLDYDPLDTGIIPPDRYASDHLYGLTAEEASHPEPLDQLLAEEEPDEPSDVVDDRWSDGPNPRAGRLEQDGTDLDALDRGIDGGAASAEEAAVHVTDDPNAERLTDDLDAVREAPDDPEDLLT